MRLYVYGDINLTSFAIGLLYFETFSPMGYFFYSIAKSILISNWTIFKCIYI